MWEFAEFLLVLALITQLRWFPTPQGNYVDAEPLYERSHAIRKTVLGRDHPDVGQSISSLAGILTHQVRAPKCSELQRSLEAVKIVEVSWKEC